MNLHECNAFTIECFEFCSSRLPEKWKITPCLVHTLLKDLGHASSCEADFGGLLSMRLLMSVAQKSSHLGNMFLRPGGVLAINHSASGLRMNGFDQPKMSYKLGRFVQSGWGTKFVINFMNNDEKRVTVVRIDPTATKMLVLKGRLVGADGWEGDNLGCSVEARVVPIEGAAEDFARKQTDYGNHLTWVYGHYADELEQLGGMLGMKVEVVG
jgi:L-fucose isomerase-like protein